jgi:ATP-dependent DNA helicase RecG
VIARFFKEIDFIEQWGNGIRKMIRLLKKSGLDEPQFRESGLFFKIIVYKKRISTEEKVKETTTKTTKETTTKTTMKTTMKTHRKLLELIKENPAISLIELAERMHLTKDGIWYHLKILKQEEILKRVGPAKGGYWEIKDT